MFQRRAGLCLGLSACLETPDAFTDPIAKGLLYVYSSRPKTWSGNPGQRHRICPAHPTLISHLLHGPSCSARLGLGFGEQLSPSPNGVLQGHRAARLEQSQSRYPPDAPPSWLLPEATRVLRDAFGVWLFLLKSQNIPSGRPCRSSAPGRGLWAPAHCAPAELYSDQAWARGRGAHRYVGLLHFKKQPQRPHEETWG